eukprot:5736221-Lingulodinium_polyedra.AAC.1
MGARVTKQEATEWQQQQLAFFYGEQQVAKTRAAARAKGGGGPPAKDRMAALDNLKALDKVLVSILGVGLAAFKPGTPQATSGTGAGSSHARPPLLVLHMDEGSPGFAFVWWASYWAKLRVAFVRDVFHREWNDCKLSITRSN